MTKLQLLHRIETRVKMTPTERDVISRMPTSELTIVADLLERPPPVDPTGCDECGGSGTVVRDCYYCKPPAKDEDL